MDSLCGDIIHHIGSYMNNLMPLMLISQNVTEVVYDYIRNERADFKIFERMIKNDSTNWIRILLEDGRVDPSAGDNYAIRWASFYGYVEVVKILLEDERVDPSARNNWAIRMASEYGHVEVVKLLLKDERVDPSANDNCAIRWASRYGHVEVVKLLLKDERVDSSVIDL